MTAIFNSWDLWARSQVVAISVIILPFRCGLRCVGLFGTLKATAATLIGAVGCAAPWGLGYAETGLCAVIFDAHRVVADVAASAPAISEV